RPAQRAVAPARPPPRVRGGRTPLGQRGRRGARVRAGDRMSGPPVRYADSSGVEIAYQVLGDGPLDLIWVSGAFTHLGVFWEYPGYRRFCEQLASFCAADPVRQARNG